MNSNNFILEAETPWESLGEGVKRQIMSYDDEIMLVKVAFEKGSVVHTHFHPHRQCTYVVSGIFEFAIETETKIVKAGDSLYMKPNVGHGVRCIESGVLIDTFNPIRKDFLR